MCSPVQVNKFSILSDIESDVEKDDEMADGSPELRQDAKRQKTADVQSPTSQRSLRSKQAKFFVHSKTKEHWDMNVPRDTKVLVIGDSNLSQVNESTIPKDCQVVVYPGAKFKDIETLAITHLSNIKLKNIVLHVGAAHWEDETSSVRKAIKGLEKSLYGKADRITFCGVPITDELDSKEVSCLQEVNRIISKTGYEYLQPPDSKDLRIRPDNKYGYVYDPVSTETLFTRIVKHVSPLN